MKQRRSAWDDVRAKSWKERVMEDPHCVDGMPSNEERLAHLDFYTREKDTAPIMSGGKKGMQGMKRLKSERLYMEEYSIELEFRSNDDGIRKVGL